MPAMADDGEFCVFRPAGISYLRVIARDPQTSAAFYRPVFGWTVDAARAEPSFEDGSGHVIGHLVADAVVGGEAGIRPYVYVEDGEDTLRRVSEHGGALVDLPYPGRQPAGGDVPRPSGQRDRRLATP